MQLHDVDSSLIPCLYKDKVKYKK